MMGATKARILVATDVVDDANLVRRLLRDEFENISLSSNAERHLEEFEKYRPDVLVLAFKTLEQSERYYLGLYRLSKLIHAIPHRTLILCDKDDVQRVYALCRKEYFDDYILFWPMTHDAPRLPMAVHHAMRQNPSAESGAPGLAEFAAQARRLAELESLLESQLVQGRENVNAANRSLEQAEVHIDAAFERFSQRLTAGEMPQLLDVKDADGLAEALQRMKSEHVSPHLRSASSAVGPLDQWLSALRVDLDPRLQPARELQALASRVRRRVLLVEDDPYQQKLIASMLEGSSFELRTVGTGTEALATLRKGSPDLILMDFNLPDISGVEATRRLKSVAASARIPVIMITGQSGKEVVVESLRAGATDFLVKPFEKVTLQAKIQRLLSH